MIHHVFSSPLVQSMSFSLLKRSATFLLFSLNHHLVFQLPESLLTLELHVLEDLSTAALLLLVDLPQDGVLVLLLFQNLFHCLLVLAGLVLRHSLVKSILF